MKLISFSSAWLYLSCLIVISSLSPQAHARIAPDFGDSITWINQDEAPSLTNLEGKSVLILSFQSWCGMCNGWSGNMLKAVEEAYRNDPKVVIVALKTDGGSASEAKSYLASRVDTSDWLVGIDKDATYFKNISGADKLYWHTWIKPDGTIGEARAVGSRYTLNDGKKVFYLAYEPNQKRFRKNSAPLFNTDESWDEKLKEAANTAEKGLFLTALKLANQSRDQGATTFKSAIGQKLETSISKLTGLLNDETNQDRYLAYMQLERISESYGTSTYGKTAKEAANAQQQQPWMNDEKEAHKDYLSIMRKAKRAEDKRDRERIKKSLSKLTEEFPKTYYGRVAKSSK